MSASPATGFASGEAGNPLKLLVAAFGANTIAYLGWYTLPLQWAVLSGELGLDQSQTSMVVTAEVLTAALVSIIMSFLVGARAPRLTLALGVAMACAGHLAALLADGFGALLATRMLAGVGEGLLWLMLNAAVARLEEPDRRFGQVNAATAVVLAIVVVSAPVIAAYLPNRSVYWILVGLTLLLTPTLLPFLRDRKFGVGVKIERPSISSKSAWLLVVAVTLWSMTLTVTYSLSVPIGIRTGASEESIHASIALSLLGIVGGAALAGWIGSRLGRLRTLTAIFAVEIVAAWVFIGLTTPAAYAVGLLVVNACVYSALPYFLGLGADLDRSGGTAAAAAGAFALGGGLSPTFGAYIVGAQGAYFNIFLAIAIATVFALLIVASVTRSAKFTN